MKVADAARPHVLCIHNFATPHLDNLQCSCTGAGRWLEPTGCRHVCQPNSPARCGRCALLRHSLLHFRASTLWVLFMQAWLDGWSMPLLIANAQAAWRCRCSLCRRWRNFAKRPTAGRSRRHQCSRQPGTAPRHRVCNRQCSPAPFFTSPASAQPGPQPAPPGAAVSRRRSGHHHRPPCSRRVDSQPPSPLSPPQQLSHHSQRLSRRRRRLSAPGHHWWSVSMQRRAWRCRARRLPLRPAPLLRHQPRRLQDQPRRLRVRMPTDGRRTWRSSPPTSRENSHVNMKCSVEFLLYVTILMVALLQARCCITPDQHPARCIYRCIGIPGGLVASTGVSSVSSPERVQGCNAAGWRMAQTCGGRCWPWRTWRSTR